VFFTISNPGAKVLTFASLQEVLQNISLPLSSGGVNIEPMVSNMDTMNEEDYASLIPSEHVLLTGDKLSHSISVPKEMIPNEILDAQSVLDADTEPEETLATPTEDTSATASTSSDFIPNEIFDPVSVVDEGLESDNKFVDILKSTAPPVDTGPKNEIFDAASVVDEGTDVPTAPAAATVICPFNMWKRSQGYTPPSGCALVSSKIPSYLKKGQSTNAFVICSSQKIGKVSIEESSLLGLKMFDKKGDSLISYIFPGPQTTINFFEGNLPDGQSYTFMNNPDPVSQSLANKDFESKKSINDNIKSLEFVSTADQSPMTCSDVHSQMRIAFKDSREFKI
jgi:hypothetical protein